MFLIYWAILFLSSLGHSAELLRPQKPVDYFSDLTTEQGIPVLGAQVAWFDGPLIRHDFPEIAHYSDDEIKLWILQNFAFMGSNQKRLDGIRNSSIPTDFNKGTKSLYRPDRWIRSAVVEAFDQKGHALGLVDIKGIGHGARSMDNTSHTFSFNIDNQVKAFEALMADKPFDLSLNELRALGHSDGLMSLGEAIAELVKQQAAQRLFDHHDHPLETVETYAILSLPVNILRPHDDVPAALYLRQAHIGRSQFLPVPSHIYTDLEGLRQSSWSLTAVDFGGVEITSPLVEGRFGPADSSAVKKGGQWQKPWVWGHEVAKSFVHGDKTAIYRHLEEMLGPTLWLQRPSPEKENRRERIKKVIERAKTANPLGEIAKSLPMPKQVLEIAMEDTNQDLRRETLQYSLKWSAAETQAELLLSSLNDDNPEIVTEAGEQLIEFTKTYFEKKEHLVRGLLLMATDIDTPRVSMYVMLAIKTLPSKWKQKTVHDGFSSGSKSMRIQILHGYRPEHPRELLIFIKRGLSDLDVPVREAAMKKLQWLIRDNANYDLGMALEALRLGLEDKDKSVSQIALATRKLLHASMPHPRCKKLLNWVQLKQQSLPKAVAKP